MNQSLRIEENLTNLFEKWCSLKPKSCTKLPHSGSSRVYYRLECDNNNAIGVYNENRDENVTFINFTNQFLQSRLNVPVIYEKDLVNDIYLIEDLGDNQLLNWLLSNKSENKFPNDAVEVYKKVIRELIRFQIIAGKNFDYSKCHQHPVFDKESILFDLNYFKTNYADAKNINYNNDQLKTEFAIFANYLLKSENKYFMFRDFQARNIILMNNEPYFIDYQGGRQGPLQYDLVSLLFQAKAQIPEKIKNQLLNYYLNLVRLFVPVIKEEFTEFYYAFALIRVLQTLGAYGLRGLIENKSHFIESIPFAIDNLVYLKDRAMVLKKLPELSNMIDQMIKPENIPNEK